MIREDSQDEIGDLDHITKQDGEPQSPSPHDTINMNSASNLQRLQELAIKMNQEKEQLELIGEEFIIRIHEMLQYYNAFEFDDPGSNGNLVQHLDTLQNTGLSDSLMDAHLPRKYLREFANTLKQRAAFFQKIKIEATGKFTEIDEKVAFYNECMKNQVLCFPYLNRVHDHTLVLKNTAISTGLARAMKSVF